MNFIIITRKGISYKIYKHDTESYNQFYDRVWYFTLLFSKESNYKTNEIKSLKWQNIKELGYEY